MPPNMITEDDVEKTCLEMLKELGYTVLFGPDISEGEPYEERKYSEVVLAQRLRDALERINKNVPADSIEEAVKIVSRAESQNLVANNRAFHKMLVNGVDVEYKRKDGSLKNDKVCLFDFENIKNNEFLAVNQFTIIEDRNNKRPDILLFVNGLPIVIIELKNPADENATLYSAFNQIEVYKQQIPSVFNYNEIVVISDGIEAHAGTITSGAERFTPWKTIDYKKVKGKTDSETLFRGMLKPDVLLDIAKNFIVFQEDKDPKNSAVKISKKLAAYHQYKAVNKAIESTVKAIKSDKRAGVVWHTQGSGKSLTMVFYAGKLVVAPELENPTIVVLTDRNDLDDQLFGTFASCHDILKQEPKQSDSRPELKDMLKVSSGGVIFTTIQKFFPENSNSVYPLLSKRSNIIVIADEAHRSQYDFIDGFAKHMRDALPNASFIGFTGTPIEKKDKNTMAVFGKYVDIYDIKQSIDDKTTVGIYYESRLAKVELKPEERLKIDPNFEEITEKEEEERKENLKSKWSQMERVVGSSERVKRIAKDILMHFEEREKAVVGKAMIVCMSRRICVDLYDEIIKLRPDWHSSDDKKGKIKIIMTGSNKDPKEWQQHIRTKQKRRDLGDVFKDPESDIKIAIVRDMWLTGFDVPCLQTMYIDKPMQGHGLMQAIARVNRVFKDKKGGLIVDYIGIAHELKKAVADYTESGGEGKPVLDQERAVELMLSELSVLHDIMHGFEYKRVLSKPLKDKLNLIPDALEHVLKQKDGEERFLKRTKKLIESFSLAVPHEKALDIKEEVGFFQLMKSKLNKITLHKEQESEEMNTAIRQIVSKAVISDRVIDIFEAVGLKKPNIEILSEDFLAEVENMPQKNLAFEALKKLLSEEIKLISRKNIVKGRSFAELLEKTIKRYTNKAIETAQVIEELIELARDMKKEQQEGKRLGLTEDEVAFYDALIDHDGVKDVMEDETLMIIAREIVESTRNSITVDWTERESIQADMRRKVKRILNKYGYPPDKQQKATDTVLEQAKTIFKDWVENKK